MGENPVSLVGLMLWSTVGIVFAGMLYSMGQQAEEIKRLRALLHLKGHATDSLEVKINVDSADALVQIERVEVAAKRAIAMLEKLSAARISGP
jgi:hypothetical protein